MFEPCEGEVVEFAPVEFSTPEWEVRVDGEGVITAVGIPLNCARMMTDFANAKTLLQAALSDVIEFHGSDIEYKTPLLFGRIVTAIAKAEGRHV